MWVRNSSLWALLMMTKVSSTNLFHNKGGFGDDCNALISKFSMKRFATIINKAHKEEFLSHINSVDSNIQFTAEDPGPDGSLPFLDILITPNEEGRLETSVYWKPTHMDQYLEWDSHHPISAKYSVVGTLYHRAKTISSNNEKLQQKDDHLTRALGNCNYPRWVLNRVKMRMNNPSQKKKNKNNQQQNTPKPYITVPYYRGSSESVKKKCSTYGVQVYFKGGMYHH